MHKRLILILAVVLCGCDNVATTPLPEVSMLTESSVEVLYRNDVTSQAVVDKAVAACKVYGKRPMNVSTRRTGPTYMQTWFACIKD